MMANAARGIDEIMGGPIAVPESPPNGVIVVDGHRIADLQIGDGGAHIVDVALEGKFRGVNADHHQTLVFVFFRPGPDIGQGAQAIDAGIGPEIHQHDLAAQGFDRQRGRIQPLHRARQGGQFALDRQGIGGGGRGRLGVHHHGIGAHHHPAIVFGHHHRGGRLDSIQQSLLDVRGAGFGNLRQKAPIQIGGDHQDRSQHQNPQTASDPFAHAQPALHDGKDPSADQQGQGQRGCRAQSISQQQGRCLQIGP